MRGIILEEKKVAKMGLGKPWIRILIATVCGILLWTTANYWNPFIPLDSDSMQVNDQIGTEYFSHKHVDIEKVTVGVYYEALCPDSRGFILRQLEPTFEKISENLIIELVPYGKATTNIGSNGYSFKCQHGARECEANMIHACAIDIITNPSVQLNFIACMIDRNLWPINITRTCAEKMQIEAEPILNCAKSTKGSELLAKYGKMTDALKPIKYIPIITLNQNTSHQEIILVNLLREVCRLFKTPPAGC